MTLINIILDTLNLIITSVSIISEFLFVLIIFVSLVIETIHYFKYMI